MDASEIVVGAYYIVLAKFRRKRWVKVMGIREVLVTPRGQKTRVMAWYDCQDIFSRQEVLVCSRKRFLQRLPDGNPAQVASVEV